jgi:hypothetical protein
MALNPNMTLIEAKTVSVAVSSVSFTTIPQTYTDLKILISGRNSYTSTGIEVTFNSTSSGYNSRRLYGGGTGNMATDTFGTTYVSNTSITDSSQTALIFGNGEIYIPNYANTSINKIVSIDGTSENNGTSSYYMFTNSIWSNTSAINTVTIKADTGNLEVGTKVYLYGITSASVGAKATGGAIMEDANYFYHVFGTSGVFTPTQSLSCDTLVIAGGGGAGGTGSGNDGGSGGGGAGGYRLLTSQSMTTTAYTITVGAGGAGGATNSIGSNGSTSSIAGSGFSTITSSGGGAGSAQFSGTANNGGSGGGGGWTRSNGTGNSGGYSPVEGFDGGIGGTGSPGSTNVGGGGGGGAGAVGGGTTATHVSGVGGNGSSSASSWGLATNTGQNVSGTVYYAGGGAGGIWSNGTTSGAAGYGGGAIGVNSGNGINATANTGGGGGGTGANASNSGGSGGSGLVIVRYAK